MSMAASSSSSWKYDVFLNFRGEDTRKIFVGHLYRALDQKAINTFIDAEELRKGNDLSELLAAIETSRLSIVVFSQNYASSTWCLKELVKILACMDAKKQIVVPIFYQVDPSEVRKQKRSFAEAFAQHERESNADMEEVESWRSALTRAANLSGWDSRKYEDDAKLIEEIVDDIFKRWIQVSSSKDDGLVGMDYHIDEVNSLLRPEVNDVFTVGIWGMGGIGKTTIARAVYDEIACQFEACCFLENVKEGFSNNGAVHMQEVLLSRILKETVESLGTLDRGSRVIMERLQRKKVFIVLDDVDELSQIEALLGKQHSFGGGSRVIITTRDKQLLSGAGPVYQPENLRKPEALKLFKQYAFRANQPTRVYDQLSRDVVQYAQGLPLALKVLGAFLDNKTVPEWEDELEKIRKIPPKGIHDVLKTSFDGLDETQKNIFLDIACFLKGMKIHSAKKILDSCGFYPHIGIRVLVDRALISVSECGKLEMHDLLEEMGREIGRRSRLWSYEDFRHVLTQNTATEAIEGIFLDSAIFKEGCSNTEAFVSMTKLRLLMIHDGYQDEYGRLPRAPHDCFIKRRIADLKFQCSQLRCLIWRTCPLKSWPSNFQFKNLVNLDMSYSCIKQLWKGAEPLEKLKFINLSYCRYLKKSPDFTKATSLEELNLEGCKRLYEVDPSISALKNLVILNLRGCKDLKILPNTNQLKSLKSFILSGCSNLQKFPEISDVMEKLSELYLDLTAIKELPSSINKLTGLTVLSLSGCQELKSLPSSIHMGSLQTLNLSGCSNLEMFPEISDVMEELTELHLDGTAIKELPSSIIKLMGLTILDLSECQELKSLPSSIHLRSLQTLNLSGCSNLEMFPEISDVMEKLSKLYLDGTAIKELPSSIRNLPRLVSLNLRNCESLGSLPDDICNLVSLTVLTLSGCSKLQNLPEKFGNLESLCDLGVGGSGIKQLPLSLLRLNKLTSLSCRGCKEMTAPFSSWSTSMEDCSHRGLVHLDLSDCNLLELSGIAHLSSLKTLDLCRNNFESLPAEMNRLQRLTDLKLEGCNRLKSIPELSSSLSFIDAHDCTALESVSRPKLLYRNLYFTFSNCFQLVQNLFEEIVETHQGNLQPLSLFMYLPGSKLSDWFSHHCSGSSVTVPLPPVSDHEILGFAVCGVTKFKYAHYTSDLSAPCFCTLKGEHGERSFRFDLLDWSITWGRLLESDHMFMGYIQWKNGVQLSERYTEATFRVELNDGQQSCYSGPPVEQHRIRRCGVRLFYANPEEVHNRSMTQPDFHHENSEAEIRAIKKSQFRVVHIMKNGEGCCYNEAEQSGGDTPDAEDLYPKRFTP